MAGEVKSVVLLVEDDLGDQKLMRDALSQQGTKSHLEIVGTGEEALEYLERTKDDDSTPRPHLILLDLNMPRKDGREALREIKADSELRRIPIVVLTTSKAEEDIYRTYELGVSSFITKPVTFEGLVDLMKTLSKYWFEIVQLPPDKNGRWV
ncbi:MAG: response regulator [Candidatus Latescibacteria bacterium]|nr:response regulator [Candidatus Latescibacterota bacterium]